MSRFLHYARRCFYSCLIVLMAVMMTRLVRPRVSAVQAVGFDMYHGVPCFMGIVPQETTLQETIQRLLPYLKPTVLVASSDPAEGVFEVDLATGRFGTIAGGYPAPDYLEFRDIEDGFPTLGEFVLFYGDPCYVRVREFTRGMVRTSLFYPGLVMTTVGASADGIDPHQQIETLSLIRVANVCYSPETRAEITDWRGFAAVHNYR